jgi:hypothetical protein
MPRTVKVTVKEGCVVYHDGAAYLAGQEIEVSAADAKTLRAQGVLAD